MNDEKNISMESRKKSLKYGSLSLAFIVLVGFLIVIVNLLANNFDHKWDLTESKVFSLTEETNNILAGINDTITITVLEQAGSDPSTTTRIVEKYGEASKNIEIKYVDPELNPEILESYGEEAYLTFGSVIVENGKKFKTLSPIDLVSLNSEKSRVQAISAESKITNAIISVTAEGEKTVYTLVGLGEDGLSPNLQAALENENYQVEELNLLTDEVEVDDRSFILINVLKKDMSKDEANKLKDYLNSGGKILVLDDLYSADRTNYESVLEQNGIQINRSIIFENEMAHRINSDKFVLVPQFSEHGIVEQLEESNYKSVMAYTQPIEVLPVKRDNLILEPLLITSADSYSRTPAEIEAEQSIEQTSSNPTGPFTVGMAISKTDGVEENPSMVVYSNSFFLRDDLVVSSNQVNLDLFMNSVNWLINPEEQTIIRPKDVASSPVEMNNLEQVIISIVTIFFIPFLIGISGFIYWYRRQKL